MLPRVVLDKLELYKVTSLSTELVKSGSFGVLEPSAQMAEQIAYERIDIAIVPGLGFDEHCHRVGYGFGFYDRLLSQLRCKSLGIGFVEQRLEDCIAVDEHDIALSKVLYY